MTFKANADYVNADELGYINADGANNVGRIQCMTKFKDDYTGFCKLLSLFVVYRSMTEHPKILGERERSSFQRILRAYTQPRINVLVGMSQMYTAETPSSHRGKSRFFNHFSVFLGKIIEIAHIRGMIVPA